VYGPFTLQQVVDCRSKLAQSDLSSCDKLAWPVELFSRIGLEPEKKRIYIVDEASTLPQDLRSGAAGQSKQESEPSSKREPQSEAVKTGPSSEAAVRKINPELIVIPPEKPSERESQERTVEKTSVRDQEQVFVKAPTYCIYSWEEQPGTSDFSTFNGTTSSLRMAVNYPLDRLEKDALTGSREFHNMDVCGRARFLKRCFQKVILDSDSAAAQTFRAWAMGRVRPVEAHMAFVMKESRLGLWPDNCWKGKCSGVGIARVKEARTAAGRLFAVRDPVWRGISHNILTNLEFSLRLLAEKSKEGPLDLHSLAFIYAGKSKKRDRYALDVDKYYRDLVSCQIDER
jgi:hypothetical protein